MVEAFPGGGEEGDIAHKADGAVGEAFADIDDATVRTVWTKIGALVGRVIRVLQANDGRSAAATDAITEPFVPLAIEVEPVGSEGVTEGADGATLGIVAAHRPESLVLVGVVGAEVDDAPGTEHILDGAQHDVVAEGGVADHVRDVKTGIEAGELE
jgi:hypothetical protein